MFDTVFFILQNRFMPDIEQVIVFRHCTRMYANRCRRCAAKAGRMCEGVAALGGEPELANPGLYRCWFTFR